MLLSTCRMRRSGLLLGGTEAGGARLPAAGGGAAGTDWKGAVEQDCQAGSRSAEKCTGPQQSAPREVNHGATLWGVGRLIDLTDGGVDDVDALPTS